MKKKRKKKHYINIKITESFYLAQDPLKMSAICDLQRYPYRPDRNVRKFINYFVQN